MYLKTYTACVEAAKDSFRKKGYSFNDDELFQIIGMDSSRPKEGETERFSIPLYKGEKLQRKAGHVQVYGRKNDYELNCYIL